MDYFLGIDPGRDGAISLIDNDMTIHHMWDSPRKYGRLDAEAYSNIFMQCEVLSELENDKSTSRLFIIIEDVTISSRWSRKSIFGFGTYFGFCLMGAARLRDQYPKRVFVLRVAPKRWQNFYLSGQKTSKQKSIDMAYRLFDNIPLDLVQPDERGDRAESLLLTYYGRTVIPSYPIKHLTVNKTDKMHHPGSLTVVKQRPTLPKRRKPSQHTKKRKTNHYYGP